MIHLTFQQWSGIGKWYRILDLNMILRACQTRERFLPTEDLWKSSLGSIRTGRVWKNVASSADDGPAGDDYHRSAFDAIKCKIRK